MYYDSSARYVAGDATAVYAEFFQKGATGLPTIPITNGYTRLSKIRFGFNLMQDLMTRKEIQIANVNVDQNGWFICCLPETWIVVSENDNFVRTSVACTGLASPTTKGVSPSCPGYIPISDNTG